MKIVLPFPPSLNRMYRMVNSRWLISAEGRAYKSNVRGVCLEKRIKPIQGELALNIKVFRPQKRGDLDNFFKGLFDSLNGLLWHDDSQIVQIIAERLDDKLNPRVEVEVIEIA